MSNARLAGFTSGDRVVIKRMLTFGGSMATVVEGPVNQKGQVEAYMLKLDGRDDRLFYFDVTEFRRIEE